MKPKPTSSMQRATAAGVEVDPRAERLEHVGGARQPGRRAVAVLGDGAAGAGGDQRRGGRDVERAPPAARAGGVEQVLAADRDACGERPHRPRQPGQLVDGLALGRAARSGTPAIWTSDALPAMISASTAAASSALRSRPPASASIERVSRSVGSSSPAPQEVREQLATAARSAPTRDGTGRPRPAARGGGRPSRRRRRRRCARARRAAPGRPRASGSGRPRAARGRPRKIVRPSCSIVVVLPCTGSCRIDASAPRLHERLVAEADAERRDPRQREAADRLERDPGLVRRARARRDDHPVVAADQQLIDGRVVVADDLELGAELAQVLDEVVGEAVVVVEDEDPHQRAYPCFFEERLQARHVARGSGCPPATCLLQHGRDDRLLAEVVLVRRPGRDHALSLLGVGVVAPSPRRSRPS